MATRTSRAQKISFADLKDAPDDGTVITENQDGELELITVVDAKNKKSLLDFKDIIAINQTPIEKGSIKQQYLLQDLTLLKKHFMSEFPDLRSREIIIDENLDWIEFINFPLPDYFTNQDGELEFYSPDRENIVVIIYDYPENGPFGIHIRRDSPNKEQIEKALGGHIFDHIIRPDDEDYVETVSELSEKGWDWVCFHYADTWNFNRKDLRKGDCLTTYMENIFAALSGAYLNID